MAENARTTAWKLGLDRPITIKKVAKGYHVVVLGSVVSECVGADGKKYVSYAGRQGFIPGSPPYVFKTQDAALSMAHRVGHYTLQLGDFVFSYVMLEGFKKKGYASK